MTMLPFPTRRAATMAIPVLLSLPVLPLHAQTASIQAPPRVIVGQPIELRWTGPSTEGEFISIDEASAPESAYGNYVHARADQPAVLRAPDEPGRYAIRYHRGTTGYAVIATHALEVADSEAVFDAIAPVEAGAEVTIAWRGPGRERDFISIMGQSYAVIGTAPITLLPSTATVSGPATVSGGTELRVVWTGPDNQELAAAMGAALHVPFEVVREGEVVASGVVIGEALRLPPGSYTIRLPAAPPRELPVTTEPGGGHTLDSLGG